MKYIARQSGHIQEDIIRNWSSWNFGQEGFEGTKEQLIQYLSEAKEQNSSFWISGFDIWVESVDSDYDTVYTNDFQIKELYEGYWVAVDNVNAAGGLSCIELDSENDIDAIKEALSRSDYFGEGQCFDSNEYELIHSENEIHIFKLID